MKSKAIQQQFSVALAALTEQVRQDATILAAILCGSLPSALDEEAQS